MPAPVPDELDSWQEWRTVCISVPEPLIPYMLNLLKFYGYAKFWQGTPEQQQILVDLWNLLISAVASAKDCEMFKLRQNALNPCVLEQSLDGGATWSKAFDYSLCRPKLSYSELNEYISQGDTYHQSILNQYDGTVASIMPYAGQQDSDTLDSLCFTVYHFMAALKTFFIDGAIAGAAAEDQNWSGAGAGMLAGSQVASAITSISIPGAAGAAVGAAAPWLALGLALGGLGALLVTAINGTDTSVYDDQEAWDELQCIMYHGLKGRAITQLAFQESISSQQAVNQNAAIIQDQMQVIFQDDRLFLDFLASWSAARNLIHSTSFSYPCECEDQQLQTWNQTFDFRLSGSGWMAVGGGTGRAEYIAGQGWRRGTGINYVRWQIETSSPLTTTITSISATYSRQNFALHETEGAVYIGPTSPILTVLGAGTVVQDWSLPNLNIVLQNAKLSINGVQSAGNTFPAGRPFPSDLYIQTVTLTGIGANPFI